MALKTKEDYEQQRDKQVAGLRSIFDYAMGIIIIALGVFFLIRGRLDLELNEKFPPDAIDIVLGIVFIIYGAWRIYRGYKKNYFK